MTVVVSPSRAAAAPMARRSRDLAPYIRWGFSASKHRDPRPTVAPQVRNTFPLAGASSVCMEIGIHRGTRHVMRSVFVRYGKDRLRIVRRRM